jgi:hypothetical protein
VLVNVQEKRCRLWWKTVAPARWDVEPVKIVDSLAIADNEYAYITAFRFANCAADCAVETICQFLNAMAQIQCMSVEFRCRIRGGLKRFTPADFKVSPSAFPREANKSISYQVQSFWIKDEWFARIAEREADAAAASKPAAHLHQGYQRRQPAPPGEPKIKRLMVISLMKHLCPGTRVETAGIAMQGNQMVPTWVVDRIVNPHFQRSLAWALLDKGIVARKRRRFEGL